MGQLLQFLSAFLHSRLSKEEGQGLVEYVLIIVLVAVALIVALQYLSTGINNGFNMAINGINAS